MPSTTFSPDSLPDLTGRVYLVTGGNTGIGKSTVIGLASHGARVYLGARSESKAMAAIEEIKAQLPSAKIFFLPLDLSSFRSVVSAARKLCSDETSLHGLVNNAGIMGVPFSLTADGYETQLQTNYLSHWLLTFHLLPLLQATAANSVPGTVRIVNVTSDGHASFAPKAGIEFDDISLEKASPMTRYGQSKLANVLHAKYLHKAYGPTTDVKTPEETPFTSLQSIQATLTRAAPSSVLRAVTPVMRCLGILDDQSKGAWSSLFAVASDQFGANDSGAYIIPYAKIGTPSKLARDEELGGRLWEWTRDKFGSTGLLEV